MLVDETEAYYLTSAAYAAGSARGVRHNDPAPTIRLADRCYRGLRRRREPAGPSTKRARVIAASSPASVRRERAVSKQLPIPSTAG